MNEPAHPRAERLLVAAVLGAFVAYYGLSCFRFEWTADFLRHAAAVRSFDTSLTAPPHEAMSGAAASVLHSPYHLAVALVGRGLGVSPYRALQLAGVLNLLLYAVAVLAFSRAFARRRWALVAALFVPLQLFLRDRIWSWSSETDGFTLRYIQAYPSFWGWGVALLLFANAERFVRSEGPSASRLAYVALTAIALAALLLGHPLTGGWALGILTVHAAWSFRTVRKSACTLLALGAAVALALAWPYPPGLLGLGAYAGHQERSLLAEQPLADLPWVHALGLAAAIMTLLERRAGFVLAALAATWCGLGLARMAGVSYGDRFLFFELFLVHFLIAEVAVSSRRGWLLGAAAVAAAVLLTRANLARDPAHRRLSSPTELLAQPPSEAQHYARLGDLRSHLAPADVVLAPEGEAYLFPEITGARAVVAESALDHPEYAARASDVAAFFSTTASAALPLEIVARWGATRILLRGAEPGAAAIRARCGAPLASDAGRVLFDAAACR